MRSARGCCANIRLPPGSIRSSRSSTRASPAPLPSRAGTPGCAQQLQDPERSRPLLDVLSLGVPLESIRKLAMAMLEHPDAPIEPEPEPMPVTRLLAGPARSARPVHRSSARCPARARRERPAARRAPAARAGASGAQPVAGRHGPRAAGQGPGAQGQPQPGQEDLVRARRARAGQGGAEGLAPRRLSGHRATLHRPNDSMRWSSGSAGSVPFTPSGNAARGSSSSSTCCSARVICSLDLRRCSHS